MSRFTFERENSTRLLPGELLYRLHSSFGSPLSVFTLVCVLIEAWLQITTQGSIFMKIMISTHITVRHTHRQKDADDNKNVNLSENIKQCKTFSLTSFHSCLLLHNATHCLQVVSPSTTVDSVQNFASWRRNAIFPNYTYVCIFDVLALAVKYFREGSKCDAISEEGFSCSVSTAVVNKHKKILV